VGGNEDVQIEQGCQVSLHFSLALVDGQLIDSNFTTSPASFRLGDGSMLPGFEAALLGLRQGQQLETMLEPEQAFGAVNAKNQHRFAVAKFRNLLEDDLITLEVGAVVSFKNAAGFDLPGVIAEISDAAVAVDFNHPLAGKQIIFKADIVAVLPADVARVNIKL
jgi:FKBP-type peptidyl-prolyl cis-trans isomerase SlpA